MLEVASGLWRWTAVHPEWSPEEDDLAGWYREVASTCYCAADAVLLVDPLLPETAAHPVLDLVDAQVASRRPLHVLITIMFHARSSQRILDRYPGSRLWAHEASRDVVAERTSVTDTFDFGQTLPGGVIPYDAQRGGEAIYWIAEHRALVMGDVVLGTEDGRLRVCPESWLGPRDPDEVRSGLRPLLDLPVERVLVSHGEPVLTGAREALESVLA